ncbi:MAG: 2,3-bisphosphoglycerate-independent phosphoglycerate mutase [Patescibacteria group bacterium]|nr:2,3-bisphosphoglycerate-independent phosphoglycerate mutase [Patescibacteria group bacterium]
MQTKNKTVMLIVLDGWGYREESDNNAVAAADTPFFDKLWRECPHSLLEASGPAVGLPEGQMGNSEVGHTTIGAGAILDTDLVRISKSAVSGDMARNKAISALFKHVIEHRSTLHVMGLVSDGGVHSHQDHLYAFLKAAHAAGVKKIAIHAFTDGRDTAPTSGAGYMEKLEKEMRKLDPSGKDIFVASLSGRYFAMDRDNNWDRMDKAGAAMFDASGPVVAKKPSEHLLETYSAGGKDELLEPVVLEGIHGRGAPFHAHDGAFIFNFRADRVRMLSQRLMEKKDMHVVAMTEYSDKYPFPTAFPPKSVETTLAAQVSAANMTQAHIAETEKFPHATYFLNGGRNEPHPGEKHILLDSRKDVKTHDQAPEMRAEAIADKAMAEIAAGTAFIFVNFANPDMVGHTANVPAIIKAVETVDAELKRVIDALDKAGGSALIIADHGNAEVNIDPETGLPHTAHTTNLVPCILTGSGFVSDGPAAATAPATAPKLRNGGLSDVAPTILDLLSLTKPKAMTGRSLLVFV